MDASLVITTVNLILKYVNTKEARKYNDRILELKGILRDERLKPTLERDQIKFGSAYYELRDIIETVNSAPSQTNSSNSPE